MSGRMWHGNVHKQKEKWVWTTYDYMMEDYIWVGVIWVTDVSELQYISAYMRRREEEWMIRALLMCNMFLYVRLQNINKDNL